MLSSLFRLILPVLTIPLCDLETPLFDLSVFGTFETALFVPDFLSIITDMRVMLWFVLALGEKCACDVDSIGEVSYSFLSSCYSSFEVERDMDDLCPNFVFGF